MTNMDCNNVIDYFNQTLTDEEKHRFEEHLQTCKDCQEELKELDELTADLPYLSELQDPPAGMKDRILNAVFDNEGNSESTQNVSSETDDNVIEKQIQKRNWLMPLLAASLLFSLIGNVYTYTKLNEVTEPETREEEETAKLVQSVGLQPTEVSSATGTASMIQKDGTTKLVVQANDLQKLEGQQVYQVWLLENGKPYRAGSFVPDQKGSGAVDFPMSFEGEHKWDTVAITLEPDATSKTPKGNIVLSSGL
ncbi:anti-sigma factor [Pseudalkalibacillus caeni]|uniref:Anti-sigma-W factor RsiW n=1 Tax=Exobacillus caeni TaxID=2574798 RepID=A0A5R9F567_9BACL|nr:anti-sigma factor [Pseudalkalibacillus caeni]TLS35963.1 anti-sigma factor [Pseudalkalibacillus caeni]